tara:strand:+ start:3610 stop:4566 length:957 start_codon:yes stop_codon:yes gene_type:complete
MTEIVPNGTWVLLYRPWGEVWEEKGNVGKVKSYDENTGTYTITNERGNDDTVMRFKLDFVVPQRDVRVIHYNEGNAAATILRTHEIELTGDGCQICLDVRYFGDDEIQESPIYDAKNNFLDQFRYFGLQVMQNEQLVKVYPGRYWMDKNTQVDDGAIGKIISNYKVNKFGFGSGMYEFYEVEMQASGDKYFVQRDEAMPYTPDIQKEEPDVEVQAVPKKIPDAVWTLQNDQGTALIEVGLYWCNDKGELRKMKDGDWKLQECVVCFTTDEKLVALIPCGHQCMCQSCFKSLNNKNCPICRCNVQDTLRVYGKQYRISL